MQRLAATVGGVYVPVEIAYDPLVGSAKLPGHYKAGFGYDSLLSNGATGPQTHEMVPEVNYDIHVASGCNLQPEFQYVFRPNA